MSTSSVVSQVSLYQRCYRSRVRIKLDPKAISTISKTSRRKEFLRVYKFDVDLNKYRLRLIIMTKSVRCALAAQPCV